MARISFFANTALTALGVASLVTAAPTAARAAAEAAKASEVEAVVVTARQREEDLQKVPVAVTAFSQDKIDALQMRTTSDLQFNTPSLSVNGNYGGSFGDFIIRGLGRKQFAGGSVTTYFSDAPNLAPSIGAAMFDMANVQVLRGPQGTLFGRATTGGAVLYMPKHPVFNEVEGLVQGSVGNLSRSDATAVLNIPLIDDTLAVRVSFNRQHLRGHTTVIGSGDRLGGQNSQALRVGVEWKPIERLRNYAVWEYHHVNEDPGAAVLVGFDPNFSLFNLPTSITAPGGAAVGGAVFGAVCNQAVATGLSPSTSACIDQRLQILAQFKPALTAELARTSQGGDALRKTNVGSEQPLVAKAQTHQLIDVATFHVGDLGFSDITVKNIFSYNYVRGYTSIDIDGVPPAITQAAFGQAGRPTITQVGNQVHLDIGPYNEGVTEELQLQGNYDNSRLIWLLGYYYSRADVEQDIVGCGNLNKVLGGVLTPNLGHVCATGMPLTGYANEKGVFGQFTLDLSGWLVDGLHFTGGLRQTKNKSRSRSSPVVFQYPSGTMVPGTAADDLPFDSKGTGWILSLDYTPTEDLLVYATSRKGYKPGGRNVSTGASGAPGFVPVFGPEKVIDLEFGAKWRFQAGNVRGTLNADVYRDWYDNIQQTLTSSINGVVFSFNANVAKAVIQGIEVESDVHVGDRLTISGQYSLNDNRYKEWFGADPLNIVRAGNPLCDAAHSPPGACNIDLHDNPFPFAPRHKGSVTVTYDFPVAEELGTVSASATVSAQSRMDFSAAAKRVTQAYVARIPDIREQISQEGYALVNARVAWDHINGADVSAWAFVNNLTDKTYAIFTFSTINTLGFNTKFFGQPRTYGVGLKYEF